ncbi:Uncharacterised protein [Vibrio cholerae]|nr:Uncharacterised protein [Vibrio cholerae]
MPPKSATIPRHPFTVTKTRHPNEQKRSPNYP